MEAESAPLLSSSKQEEARRRQDAAVLGTRERPKRSPAKGRGRIMAIEGLRTVLCVWIVIYHWPGALSRGEFPEATRALARASWVDKAFLRVATRAWIAPDVFFTISGFVSARGPGSFRSVAKTVLRLAPAYYASLLAEVFVAHLRGGEKQHYYTPLLQLTMSQSWLPFYAPTAHKAGLLAAVFVPYEWNTPCWFVSTLVGVYLIHALCSRYLLPATTAPDGDEKTRRVYRVLWLLLKLGLCCVIRMLPALLIQSGAVQFCDPSKKSRRRRLISPRVGSDRCDWRWLESSFYVFPPACYCSFLAGAVAARLVDETTVAAMWRPALRVADVALAVAAVSVAASLGDDSVLIRTQNVGITPIVCAFLGLAAMNARDDDDDDKQQPVLLRVLSHPALTSLAPATYAIYCFQMPLMQYFVSLRGWSPTKTSTFGAYFLALALLAATFNKFVEEPCIRFIANNLLNQPPPPPPPPSPAP